MSDENSPGPLAGLRVLEVGGIGPGPFAGMILADLGAEVIRIDRPGGSLPLPLPPEKDLANRGKKIIALDLKKPEAIKAVLALAAQSDVLIEGFRPGVVERLGFGPDVCLVRNPRLIFGRMTGWGQTGRWASKAGHDINYVAMAGGLFPIGPADGPPVIPLNLLGDYAGGSTYLVMGILSALWERNVSGRGQVVDAAIVDGVAHLLTAVHGFVNADMWIDERGQNFLDGAAPFYRIYETADQRHMAVGSIEPAFFAELCELVGVSIEPGEQHDRSVWPRHHEMFEAVFGSRSQAHWISVFEESDACVTAVPSVREAPDHPHLKDRQTFLAGKDLAPAPAPKFSRTPSGIPESPKNPGADTRKVLTAAGLDADALIACGAATEAN